MSQGWIDVSLTLKEGMINWPGNPAPQIKLHKSLKSGDKANVSVVQFCVHSGTHIDLRGHSFAAEQTADQIKFENLIGSVRVIDLPDRQSISQADLETFDWQGIKRVFFRTDNVHYLAMNEFFPEYVFLEPAAASFLVEKGISLVGIDYFSVEKYKAPHPLTHEILLEANVIIIEGLDLRAVQSGDYQLICLPLKVNTIDGAPVRVVLKPDPA